MSSPNSSPDINRKRKKVLSRSPSRESDKSASPEGREGKKRKRIVSRSSEEDSDTENAKSKKNGLGSDSEVRLLNIF